MIVIVNASKTKLNKLWEAINCNLVGDEDSKKNVCWKKNWILDGLEPLKYIRDIIA